MPEDKKKDRARLEASDANADAMAEAGPDAPTGQRTDVDYGGQTWSVDTDGDGWPLAASLAFSKILNAPDDQPIRAIEYMGDFLSAVLGPAQWATFQRGRRTSELRAMFDAVMQQAFGAPAGE